MPKNATLSKKVERRMADPKVTFSESVLNALRLAERYDDGQPSAYVLPIDAMAGFPSRLRIAATDAPERTAEPIMGAII